MYPKNNASPPQISIGAVVQISDGAVQTSGCTVRIIPLGVAEGDGVGATAYSTDGVVLYTPTQAETNYASFILIAKKTGCIPASILIVPTESAVAGRVSIGMILGSVITGTAAQISAAFTKFFDKASPTGTINSLPDAVPGATGGLGTTNGTKLNQTADLTAGQTIAATVAGSVGSVTAGVTLAASQHVIVDSGTVTTLTNLPAVPTDWLTAAGVKADAVTKVQNGLATPTNITAGTIATVTNLTNLPAAAATAAELAKVPKSDSNVTWNATALASINAEVDTALNTAIPGSPTADSINERIVAIDAFGAPPAVSAIADGVWDEALSGHSTAGTAGLALSTASSGGVDPSVLADAIWDEALSGHSTSGTTGKKLTDISTTGGGLDAAGVRSAIGMTSANLDTQLSGLAPASTALSSATWTGTKAGYIDAAISGVTAPSAATVAAAVRDVNNTTPAANSLGAAVNSASAPTAAQNADAVWDEAMAGHAISGSAGAALSAAGAAGNPWIETLPGAYISGQAGYIIGTYLDAKVSAAGGGTGAIPWSYTLTSSADNSPIGDADVWVTTDAAGLNVIASGKTNQSGIVSFLLDAGIIYVWSQKTGYNFTNPDIETVS